MKSSSASRKSPTPVTHIYVTDELQVVGVYDAPCRNRTCNLMIKSHGTDPASQRVRVFATIKIATPPHQVSATRTRQSPTDLIYSPKEDGSLSNALLIWKVLA